MLSLWPVEECINGKNHRNQNSLDLGFNIFSFSLYYNLGVSLSHYQSDTTLLIFWGIRRVPSESEEFSKKSDRFLETHQTFQGRWIIFRLQLQHLLDFSSDSGTNFLRRRNFLRKNPPSAETIWRSDSIGFEVSAFAIWILRFQAMKDLELWRWPKGTPRKINMEHTLPKTNIAMENPPF